MQTAVYATSELIEGIQMYLQNSCNLHSDYQSCISSFNWNDLTLCKMKENAIKRVIVIFAS